MMSTLYDTLSAFVGVPLSLQIKPEAEVITMTVTYSNTGLAALFKAVGEDAGRKFLRGEAAKLLVDEIAQRLEIDAKTSFSESNRTKEITFRLQLPKPQSPDGEEAKNEIN